MAFWCIILIVFAFLSYAIDSGRLSYLIFRHLWNILLLGLGILLVIRVKNKENLGFLEHLEFQGFYLFMQMRVHASLPLQFIADNGLS